MSGRVWPFAVLIAAALLGRALSRRLHASGRYRTPWTEPAPDAGREVAGVVLLIVGVAGAALIAWACPLPRIE
jgi:hypothetical protein